MNLVKVKVKILLLNIKMACILESPCLSKSKYQDKLDACKKKYTGKELEECMGLSDECLSCMGGLSSNIDIHSKCCSTDSQEFVEGFFKKNMVWFIPLVVVSGTMIISLIALLLWAVFS
jgi:hypothetical protein